MSATGMPSVMQTMSAISASIASADRVGRAGRRHIDHARVGAGLGLRLGTVSNTGRPRCVVPPLPGEVPPTILVP